MFWIHKAITKPLKANSDCLYVQSKSANVHVSSVHARSTDTDEGDLGEVNADEAN